MGNTETDSDAVEAQADDSSEATTSLAGASKDADESFSRDREVDSSTEPCPLAKSITGRFEEEEVKCGSLAKLEADAVNIDDGQTVQFALRRLPDRGGIGEETAPLSGSQVRNLEWISKKPTDDWPEDEVDFQVSADGKSADSENKLHFHRYAYQTLETKTFNCASGIYGWTGKFDIKFEDGKVIVRIKIKLVNRLGGKPATGDPMPAVGDPVTDADKLAMKTDIEDKLTDKWLVHREGCRRDTACDCPADRKCCKFRVEVQVDFVESGEHHVVNLFQGAGQATSSNWTRVKTRDNSWAHETGHLLAWYDEYSTGAVGTAPRWVAENAGAVMNTGLTVPETYYWDFRDWYASKTGETWEMVSP